VSAPNKVQVPAAKSAVATPARGRALIQRKCGCSSTKSSSCEKCEESQSPLLQKKLVVGASNDPFEFEADRIADEVLRRGPETAAPRTPVRVRPVPAQPTGSVDAPEGTPSSLSNGHALDPELRRDMEQRFGYDFGDVRLHADAAAEASAQDLNARAYTIGHHIVFGAGQLSPATEQGRRLLAHELAHVVQQTGPAAISVDRESLRREQERERHQRLRIGAVDSAFEKEADRVASHMMQSPPPAARMPDATASGTHGTSLNAADLTSGGTPLPGPLRNFYERRFGRDLREVRLHVGQQAEAYNHQFESLAFTYGDHVWFGHGQQPGAGYLLAHELAHVIQQRQPKVLAGEHERAVSGRPLAPRVQRFGNPFWVPLGPKGVMTGRELHKFVLDQATALNSDLDSEAFAPNGDTFGTGVGHHGSMDLYRSTPRHVIPAIYFAGEPDNLEADGRPTPRGYKDKFTEPRAFRTNKPGIDSGRFRPHLVGDDIKGISEGPTSVEIGELKPASKPMVAAGVKQLRDYALGMSQAARLTNEWSRLHPPTTTKVPQWNLTTVVNLPHDAFTTPIVGKETDLVVADIKEKQTSRDGEYRVDVRDAWVKNKLNVRGKLHIIPHTKGSGLWVYYAKPNNLAAFVENLRSQDIAGEVDVANRVQDEVIEPLLKAPDHVAGFSRGGTSTVQRKYDTPPGKFTENFKFKPWQENVRKLRTRFQRPTGTDKTQLDALELLDGAYDAERALEAVPGTGPSILPKGKDDLIDIFSQDDTKAAKATTAKTTPAKKKTQKSAGDVFGWLKRWTGVPIEALGLFRAAFGGAFVKMATFFSSISKNPIIAGIKDKLQSAFAAVKMPTSALGTLMKEGFAFALGKVSDLLLPSVFRMIISSLKGGIVDALKSLLGDDFIDKVFKTAETWKQKFEILEGKVKSVLDPILKIVEKVAAVVQKAGDIVSLVSKIQSAIRWGLRLARCGGVWTCITNLADFFTDYLEEKAILALKGMVLSACNVRSLIAGAIRTLLGTFPFKLAKGIVEGIRDLIPDGLDTLKKVFSHPVVAEELPKLKEMDDTDCWSIDLGFSLFDDGFNTPKPKPPPPIGITKPGKMPDAGKPPPGRTPPAPDKGKKPAGTPPGGGGGISPQRPWDPRDLRIQLSVRPPGADPSAYRPDVYIESLDVHTRQEKSHPEYAFFCVTPAAYVARVSFFVDTPFSERPRPYKQPAVTVRWTLGKESKTLSDDNPRQNPRVEFSPGQWSSSALVTKFDSKMQFDVYDKDVIDFEFTMNDKDSGKDLVFRDKVKIKIIPCG
jgi:hypothetical protein